MSKPAKTNEQKVLHLIQVLNAVGAPTPNLNHLLQGMHDMALAMDSGSENQEGDKQVANELLSLLSETETMVWRLAMQLAKVPEEVEVDVRAGVAGR